jgi:hypothetical protein
MKDTKLVGDEIERKTKKWDTKDVSLEDGFVLKKPIIDETKVLADDEKAAVEFSLKMEGRRLIHTELRPHKNDYNNHYDRGSVAHTPKCRNYCFHKIVIPDGSTIKETNFTQLKPNTNSISGKNITFIGCNLTNIALDPSWVIKGCVTQQVDLEAKWKAEADALALAKSKEVV